MKKEYTVVIEQDSDGYFVASVPVLRGCHTQAKSLDELMQRIHEAVELYLVEDDDPAETVTLVGIQRIAIET